jgi:hypothetical protein
LQIKRRAAKPASSKTAFDLCSFCVCEIRPSEFAYCVRAIVIMGCWMWYVFMRVVYWLLADKMNMPFRQLQKLPDKEFI